MTIQQHASFDAKDAGLNATSKANPALTKLVQMWENNNAKRAIKGSGISLMALSLTACGGSDDVAVDITSDNAQAILTAITAIDPAATTIQGVADNAADAADASTLASINTATGLSLTAANSGAEVIAAIQGTADNTAAIAAAVAAVDITTDNAALISAAEAVATTAALTAADLTIYASVDAAKAAGLTTTSTAAVTTALTDASNVAHATVDAAITSNDAAIALAATNTATAAAEATLVSGTGFATVASLSAAYTAAIGATAALSSTLSTGSDSVFGTANNDTITGTLATYTAGDIITDGTSTDSDTLNITTTSDIAATPTVAGIENINFTLTSIGGGLTGPAIFSIDAANINTATITGAATHASTAVTTLDVNNLKTGMTVASSVATIDVATVGNADTTVTATGATQTIVEAGAGDTLTITGGNLTVSATTVEEAITITATGTVTMNEAIANAASTAVAVNITAGDDVTITDISDIGTLDATSGGDILVTLAALDGAINLTTTAGDIAITNTDASVAALTATAVGAGPADTGTAADGAILVSSADGATSAVLTSTDTITITSLDSATAVTLSAAANSTLDNVDVVSSLSLASTSAAATPIVYAMNTNTGTNLDTLTITGSNNVSFSMDATDLVAAVGNNGLAATDSSSGTSRLVIKTDAAGAGLNLSNIALDEIEVGFDQGTNTLTFASGAQAVISANQTDLDVSAAAVAGNTLNLQLDSATVGTGVTLTDLSATNVATINVTMADDATATHVITNMGVAATTNVTIAGNGGLTLGSLATAQVANSINATGVTGNITANVVMAGAFTSGSGDDTLNISDAVSATRVIDGGAGADSLVFAASDDFSGAALTVTNVETFNVAASSVVLAGSQVTGQGYAFVGNAIGDTLAINVMGGTGETVDISGSQIVLATVTITGAAGADNLIGSATQATTFAGGAGSDVITGGAGADIVSFIMHTGDADTITLGGGADVVASTNATAATVAVVTIRDFDAGTSTTIVDTLNLSDAALTGLTTTTNMVDTGAADVGTTGVVVHVTTDGGTITGADLTVLSQSYATDTLALAGIKTAGSDTIDYSSNLTDNDSFLIAYQSGANVNIAVATSTAAVATTEGVDTLVTIVTLEGVTAADLNTNDFVFIA